MDAILTLLSNFSGLVTSLWDQLSNAGALLAPAIFKKAEQAKALATTIIQKSLPQQITLEQAVELLTADDENGTTALDSIFESLFPPSEELNES